MGQKVHPLGFRLGITQKHKGQWFEDMKNYPNTIYQDYVLRNCLFINFKNTDITSIDIERSLNKVVVKVTAAHPKFLINNVDLITKYLNALLKFMIIYPSSYFESSKFTNNPCFATALSLDKLANTKISQTTLEKWNEKIRRGEKLFLQALKNRNLSSLEQSIEEDSINDKMAHTKTGEEYEREKEIFFGNDPKLTLLIGSSRQSSIVNSALLTAKTIQEQLEKRVPFRRAVKIALRKSEPLKGIKIQISGRLNGAEIARSEWIRQGRVPLHTLRAQVDYCSHQAKTQYGILGIKVWIFKGYQD